MRHRPSRPKLAAPDRKVVELFIARLRRQIAADAAAPPLPIRPVDRGGPAASVPVAALMSRPAPYTTARRCGIG